MNKYITVKSKTSLSELYDAVKRSEGDTNDAAVYIQNSKNNRFKIIATNTSFRKSAEVIADFLIRNYISLLVDASPIKSYGGFDVPEITLVKNSFFDIITKFDSGYIVSKIQDDIIMFADAHGEISIDGFLLFTFKKYEEDIFNILRKSVIETKTEEVYKSLISGLSAYFDSTEIISDTINIIKQSGNDCIYLDENSRDITAECRECTDITDIYDGNDKIEDEILNVLICRNPRNIILHLKDGGINQNFLYTLESILGERFKICTNGCGICKK